MSYPDYPDMQIRKKQSTESLTGESGMTLVQMLIVFAIMATLTAIALPQLTASRRRLRSAAIPRDFMTQLRLTRQQAMTQHMVYSLRYDTTSQQVTVINHMETGITYDPVSQTMVMLPPCNPPQTPLLTGCAASADTVPDVTVTSTSLAGEGVVASEMAYGVPSDITTTPSLTDKVTMTPLPTGGVFNITFQPSGAVVDANGNPLNYGLFIYNKQAQDDTASAITILGASGRIKMWRYSSSANNYVE